MQQRRTERRLKAEGGEQPRLLLRWILPLALLAFAAFEFRAFLADGLPIFFDAHSHLARSWMAHRALAAGHFPAWSNEWYSGYRLLDFYSPGYYLATAVLSFATRDPIAATKLALFVGQLASVLGMYLFVARLSDRPWLAAFAALLLVFSAQRMVVLGSIGNYPSVLIYLFTPLLLYATSGLGASGTSPLRFFAGQSLLLAGLVLGHLPNFLAILPALFSFQLAWIWQCDPAGGARRPALLAAAASLVASLGLASFALVPMLAGLEIVSLSLSPFQLQLDIHSLGILLGLEPYSLDRPFAQNQGALWWLLAAIGGVSTLLPSQRKWRPLVWGLVAALLSVLVVGDRAAIGVGFFLFPLCAAALEIATRHLARRQLVSANWLVPLVGMGLAVAVPSSTPSRSPRYEPTNALDVYTTLPQSQWQSRTFDVTASTVSLDGFYGWSSFSPYFSARSIPFGAFPQGASLYSNITTALAGALAQELLAAPPTLSEQSADLLYLLNVEFLIDRASPELRKVHQLDVELTPVLSRLQASSALGTKRAPGVFQLRRASPAIFAPELEALPAVFRSAEARRDGAPALLAPLRRRWQEDPLLAHPDPLLDLLYRTRLRSDSEAFGTLLADMGIDRSATLAERFFVDSLPESPRQTPARASKDASFEVLKHFQDQSRVELEARASAPGFVRLSYSYDPQLVARLDGEVVDVRADALGAGLLVAFPSGHHQISLEGPKNTLRPYLLALSALLAAGLAALIVFPGRHSR